MELLGSKPIHRIEIWSRRTQDDKGQVVIGVPDGEPDFEEWMLAAEYLLHLVATKSELPYKSAIRKLSEGAKTYRNLLSPGTNGCLGIGLDKPDEPG